MLARLKMRIEEEDGRGMKTPPRPVRASHWGVLPSRGTEAHSVLLLKASLAPIWEGEEEARGRERIKRG